MPEATRVVRVARRVAALELPIVAAMAPALWFPTPARLMVLLVVPFVWGCSRVASGRLIPRTPLNTSIALLLIMVVVSAGVTFDFQSSLGKIAGVLLGALVFWAVVRWTSTPDRLRWGTAAFVLTGGVLAGIGLLGTNWMLKFPALGALIQQLPHVIRGVPGAEAGFQPNAVAGALVLFVPLQVVLMTSASEWWWVPAPEARGARAVCVALQAGLLLLTFGTLLLTQSRGAWAGTVVAAVMLLAWHSARARVATAVGAAAVVVVATTVGVTRLAEFASRHSVGSGGLADTFDGRAELWSRAILGIQDFPWVGMGMNMFRDVMPVVYPSFLVAPGTDVVHAHNHLLQVALDLGLPGLIAYLAMWMGTGGLLWACQESPQLRHRLIARGLAAGLAAHFVFGITDAIALGAKVGILFWVTLAFSVALYRVDAGVERMWPKREIV